MADFLVIDVGGANLAIEVVQGSATLRRDSSGVSLERALGGQLQITKTYDAKPEIPFTTKWLTTEEYLALLAAAKWPRPIVVGGEALRNSNANTVPQTITAVVEVTQADYVANDLDFLYLASVLVRQVN